MKSIPIYNFDPYQVSWEPNKKMLFIIYPCDQFFPSNLPDDFGIVYKDKVLIIKGGKFSWEYIHCNNEPETLALKYVNLIEDKNESVKELI